MRAARKQKLSRMWRPWFTGLLSLLLTLVAVHARGESDAGGASSYCDSSLQSKVAHDSPLAYRDRGDRCEGVYVQPVSGVNLEWRSLIEASGGFTADGLGRVQVEWSVPPEHDGASLHLRALGIKPELYYRMDTRLPVGQGQFLWDGSVLAGQSVSPGDLGLMAWIEGGTPGRPEEPLYLPLRVGPEGSVPGRSGTYRATFQPALRLLEVRYGLYRLDAAGTAKPVFEDRKDPTGYYPANRATSIEVTPPAEAGLYEIRLSGKGQGNRSAVGTLVFYSSGGGAARGGAR